MTKRRSTPTMTIAFIAVFAAGLLLGHFVSRMINPPEDDCNTDLEVCLTSLETCTAALDSTMKDAGKWLCKDAKIPISSIPKREAKAAMDRYVRYWDHARTRNFMGMNIHCGHLHMIEKYLEDTTLDDNHGYRIYMGLKSTSSTTKPTENDLIHFLFPVSADGKADTSATNVLGFDPPTKFELPCPDFCDLAALSPG